MTQLKHQILLLGSDPKLADAALQVIQRDGGKLNFTGNGEEALRQIENHPPDLVLLDLNSAGAEGLNLLGQFKQAPPSQPVFTVALASSDDPTPVLRAFELGLNEFIPLPLENSLFRAQLRGALILKQQLAEMARRQQELTGAWRDAEARCRAKSDFLAAMSHEIRTPMNGVVAMTGLMMESPVTPEQHGYLETIHHSSESLLKIINDILDFSKIEAGKMELERREFDLRVCIEEAFDLFATPALEKQLDLVYETDETIPALIEGDPQRLRQVLVNLVGNAMKFTERGDIFIQVKKPAGAPGEGEDAGALRLHFAVRDTGIGIQPDRLARLFQAFTQADASTSRTHGGTGLGLAISRRLVELMGGKMWVESLPGEGSTFHFTINVKPAPASPPTPIGRRPRLAGLKILILEDNATSRNVLGEQCRRWGMQPQAVENAPQAMELLRNGAAFDLALVDWQLTSKDGGTIAAEIQKLPAAAKLPVVLLTPLRKIDHGAEMALKTFTHTVNKPVKPAQLAAALEGALSSPQMTPTRIQEPPKPEPPMAGRLPLRILLVDDNAINQKVAVRILQQIGYQPETAGDGQEALEKLDRQPFDFIFMDVMMPKMDGLEATRLLRKRQVLGEQKNYQSHIIVVAMTAHAMQGDREKCLAAGMDDYLSKPVRPKDVRDMIERWAGKIMKETQAPQTETPQNPAEDPPVDMSRLTDITDGNHDSLRELVEMYLKQTHKQLAQIAAAIRDEKAGDLRSVAHSCAGSSATLGMTRLVPQMRSLEKLGADGTLTGAGQICKDAGIEFNRIREFLKTHPELTATVTHVTLE